MLSDRQVSNICISLANNFATDEKLPKAQISKIVYSDSFQLLGPLLKINLQLAKNVLTSQAKSFKLVTS